MAEVEIGLNKADLRYFSVYNEITKLLEYSKYTFLFEIYAINFDLENKTKVEVFDHFLLQNETDWKKIIYVKTDLTKYFGPMTQEVLDYNDKFAATFYIGSMNLGVPDNYVSENTIIENQWKLVDYGINQTRRLNDYFFTDTNLLYTKYNFNFEKYSTDYHVYGNNLVVFTDFVFRTLQFNDHPTGLYGNSSPGFLGIYFLEISNLRDYMSEYGCTSIWKNVTLKNVNNIDYIAYGKLKNLPFTERDLLMEDYLRWGQFERLEIIFNPIEKTSTEINLQSICNIYTSETSGTGFLYQSPDSNDKGTYIVTCAHLIDVSNLDTFRASFNVNQIDPNVLNNIAEFRLMGRDLYTDILVGIFDPTLPYNKSNNVNISQYNKLRINDTFIAKQGDEVYTIGAIGYIDNDSYLEGKIMDPKYFGNFDSKSTCIPPNYLIDMRGVGGISGAPLFSKNNDKEVIGMLAGKKEDKFLVGLTPFYLDNIVTNIIKNYKFYSILYKDNSVKLSFFIKNGFPKKWLGINAYYFNQKFSKEFSNSLSNFNYLGGVVITDFILGYNWFEDCYIYDTDSLSKEGAVVFNSPLINSKMYKRYIDTSRNPIVMTALSFYDGLTGVYKKISLGKYGSQDGLYNFYYGLTTTGAVNTSNFGEGYFNSFARTVSNVIIEYYYYDGLNWIFETEEIGGNSKEWYTTYIDNLGNKFLQNRFELPLFLVPYTKSYVNSLSKNTEQWAVNKNDNQSENEGTTSMMQRFNGAWSSNPRARITSTCGCTTSMMCYKCNFKNGTTSMMRKGWVSGKPPSYI